MANGSEDTIEKNKDRESPLESKNFTAWTNFQGREDAEMLQEKAASQKRFRSQRDYEDAYID